MASERALWRIAARRNAEENTVRQVQAMSLRALLDRLEMRRVFMSGGDAQLRADAVAAMIRAWEEESPMPVVVLTQRNNMLTRALQDTLPEDVPLTVVSSQEPYDYLWLMQRERIIALLMRMVGEHVLQQGTEDYCRAFMQAVELRNPSSLCAMMELAKHSDADIASMLRCAGYSEEAMSYRDAGLVVRSVISRMAHRLVYQAREAGTNMLVHAALAAGAGRGSVMLLDFGNCCDESLEKTCLAEEIMELAATFRQVAVVISDVLLAEDDPLLRALASIRSSGRICVSAPCPGAVPGGMEAAGGTDAQILFPYGDIGRTAREEVLGRFGSYMHTDVNESTGRELFSLPWERHDHASIARQSRPLISPAMADSADVIVAGTGRYGRHEILLVRRLWFDT